MHYRTFITVMLKWVYLVQRTFYYYAIEMDTTRINKVLFNKEFGGRRKLLKFFLLGI